MTLSVVYRDERVLLAHEGPLFISAFIDAPTMVQMRAVADHGRRIGEANGPLALVNFAFSGVPTFSDEVRQIATDMTRDASLFAIARAHTVLMSGFTGAAVRGFIGTFVLLGRPTRPTKVFAELTVAANWVASHVSDPAWTAARVEAACAQARAIVTPPPSA